MKAFLEFIEILKLAYKLYKKVGYERARQKLLKVVEDKDDKETAELVSRVIHDDEL